ncbi:hypothetical protein BGZ73_002728 [Actinomortierella ambigua]|nr:hypothetical protein BGZ73_002728 [Actinomortierella ambigua]
MASTLLSIDYDSNSDSAEDLDFEPESDLSQDTDFDSDSDKDADDEQSKTVDAETTATVASETEPPASMDLSAPSLAPPAVQAEPKRRPKGRPRKTVEAGKTATKAAKATKPRAKKSPAAKRGDNQTSAKTKKASKDVEKKSSSVTGSHPLSTQGLLPMQASQRLIDLDHPLETFRWRFSAFTQDFLKQHQERDKMAQDLRQAVEEMVGANTNASWRLQELEERVETSRQELRMTLDEISFRKSQLRDMSRMAVEIVKKLSSRRDPCQPTLQENLEQQEQQQEHQVQRKPSLPEMVYEQPMDADSMDIDPPLPAAQDAAGSSTCSVGQTDATFVNLFAATSGGKDSHEGAQSRDSVNTEMADPSSLHLVEPNMAEGSSCAKPDQSSLRKDISEHLSGLNEFNIRSFLERMRQLELERREVWSTSSPPSLENRQDVPGLSL